MRIFTYATHEMPSPWFRILRERLPVEVLPVERDWTRDFYAKSFSFAKQLETMPDEELVMCVDAFDVVPSAGCTLQRLAERLTRHFRLDKVVFNAEKMCYPDESLSARYPTVGSPWRYLNAGIVAGTVGVCKEVYRDVLPRIPGSMDQLEFTKELLAGGRIELDTECVVFQSLMGEEPGELYFGGGGGRNIRTGTEPLLWHGNGTSHPGLQRLVV